MKKRIFTCDGCGESFESGSLEGEAEAEALALFGKVPEGDDRGVLCDDCYREFMEWLGDYPTAGCA